MGSRTCSNRRRVSNKRRVSIKRRGYESMRPVFKFKFLFVTPDILTSRVGSYKTTMYSFFTRIISEWNNLSQDVRSKPSVASFRSALLKVPGPVEINLILTESCTHVTLAVTDIRYVHRRIFTEEPKEVEFSFSMVNDSGKLT